jgi:hypothetical protein
LHQVKYIGANSIYISLSGDKINLHHESFYGAIISHNHFDVNRKIKRKEKEEYEI